MPILKVAFSDGAKENNPACSRIMGALAAKGLASESSFNDADILFFSDFGEQHWGFKGLKVYITGENMLPDFDQCDLAYTPHEDQTDWRCIRLPYYAQLLPQLGSLVRGSDWRPESFLSRPRFCSFITSNPRGPIRNSFFKKLNRIKKVDSAGKHFNNFGEAVKNKLEFLQNYRFNIAFENSRSPGYITEKLIEPLLMGCVPIYWGAPDVTKDFNPDCMINVSDFKSLDAAIDYIIAAENNPELRLRHLRAFPFPNNKPPVSMRDEYIISPILDLIKFGSTPSPRKYRARRLREHTFSSPMKQSLVSLRCRIDGVLWKIGWNR